MSNYDQATIADLVDGKLLWPQLKAMMSNFKDLDRFEKYIAVLQERVPWNDKILLPLGPHLFIVQKAEGSRVTKSTSGYEFGDYRENWKRKARIFVRDTEICFAYRRYCPALPRVAHNLVYRCSK